jgi:hypothetical protein
VRLNYHKGKDGNGVIQRFTWTVESAAARLGFAGNGGEAVSFWLDRIKRDAPAAYLQTFNRSNGETEEVYSVEVLDICGLSADYCRKCQADEIRSGAVADGALDSPQRDAFQPEATSAEERLDDSQLPELAPDAAQRIAEVLKEARAHVSENPNETRVTQAMALYLDSIAWEYALTQSSTVFEALIDGISAKARGEFAGDLAVAEDRKRYWIKEAQERAANEIVGREIPVRVAAHQVPVFHDLELQFRALPSARGDLHAVFFDEVRFNVFSENPDPTEDILERQKFELLARQAMAALGFRFADSSRAIFYWLQFLKQKSPHFKQWKCHRLCAASADFCAELKTRARESTPRENEGGNAEVGPLPKTVSPASIPSGQSMGGSLLQNLFPAPAISRRTCGNPIVHVDLFFPLRRHSIVPGANGPSAALCDKLRDQIVRIADRIQAVENPEFPPAEAADRWLDRLSPDSPAVWELGHVLDASIQHCQTYATYLIRAGNPLLAAQFDGFANQFGAVRALLGNGEALLAQGTPVELPSGGPNTPKLNTKLIRDWMKEEGHQNKELAGILKVSPRVISSIRNNGCAHGGLAITKLANLMGVEVEQLYLE